MNINDLTIGQAKELAAMFGPSSVGNQTLNGMIGSKVIVRTYSAGCWFGTLDQKSGNEVILTQARRMFYWYAEKGISLSACSIYGVKDKSKIVEAVEQVWLEAIEIIPCSELAIESIEGQKNAEAQ